MKTIIYIFAIIALFATDVCAIHIIGSTTQYKIEVSANGTFNLTGKIIVYRDAKSNGAPLDNPLEIGIYQKIGLDWKFYKSINGIIMDTLITTKDPKNTKYCVQTLRQYEKGIYPFSVSLPQINGEYMVAYQRCCRVENITNMLNSGEQGSAVGFIITEEGQKVNNVSPTIKEDFFSPLEIGKKNYINFNHTDEDQDKVAYSLNAPFNAGGTDGATTPGSPISCSGVTPKPSNCLPPYDQIKYANDYSALNPFGDNVIASFDQNSGQYEVTPSIQGYFAIGLKMEEYRDGKLLSINFLDMVTFAIVEPSIIYKAYGVRYYDKNQNAVKDLDEININIPVKLDKSYCELFYSEMGRWDANLYLDSSYMIASSDSLWVINAPNGNLLINASSIAGDSILLDIPMIPVNATTHRLSNDLYISNPRCNEDVTLNIVLNNTGSVKITSNVILKLDSLVKFYNAEGNPFSLDSIIIWKDIILDIFEERKLQVYIKMPNETHTGKVLNFILQCNNAADSTIVSNHSLNTVVRCSFDPNDKLSFPERDLQKLTKPDENIYYTIRFQNLGNDYAEDIYINDNIASILDLSTFKVLESSHPCTWTLNANGLLKVEYKNIKLPTDKTSIIESQGYFMFRIKPIPNLLEGQQINNSASIVFDKNNPIYTHFTLNTISYFIKDDIIKTQQVKEVNTETNIYLAPNPAYNDRFKIINTDYWNASDIKVHIYNKNGQLIKEVNTKYNTDISANGLIDDVYLIHLQEGSKLIKSMKLVITH